MAERLRTEAADFEIVFHYRQRLAQAGHARRKKLALIREARPPGEHAPDVQPFALDLPEHVLGRHTFRGTRIMRATGAVDMMITAVETVRGGLNPAFEFEGKFHLRALGNRHFAAQPSILGAARDFDREFAGR